MPTVLKSISGRAEAPLRSVATVKTVNRLHMRPAATLIKELMPFRCQVVAGCRGQVANARSMLGLLQLGAAPTSNITFTATGSDAVQAIEAIDQLFAAGLMKMNSRR